MLHFITLADRAVEYVLANIFGDFRPPESTHDQILCFVNTRVTCQGNIVIFEKDARSNGGNLRNNDQNPLIDGFEIDSIRSKLKSPSVSSCEARVLSIARNNFGNKRRSSRRTSNGGEESHEVDGGTRNRISDIGSTRSVFPRVVEARQKFTPTCLSTGKHSFGLKENVRMMISESVTTKVSEPSQYGRNSRKAL